MRSLICTALVLLLPQFASAQTCTETAGAFTGNSSGNLCNFTHQLAQDCAATTFSSSAIQQAIYTVQLSASSNAVIQLAAGSAFTPYIALWAQGSGCSGTTGCGSYENIGGSAGSTISLPSTSGLAAGTYDLIVSDVLASSAITCPNANANYTLSVTSGSLPVKLQEFSVN
jgi:hypothetical protein